MKRAWLSGMRSTVSFTKLFGVLAIGRGYLLEPCLNIGREMYFHTPQA
jgi:hypothetical protein